MPIFRIGPALHFPDPADSDPDGLLAVGGDLSPERLLLAYAQGIFPWYSDGLPILWHSPDPRTVLRPGALRMSRSLRKTLRQQRFEVRFDSAFDNVISRCAEITRPEANGTWITHEMRSAYIALHELGFAHSSEAWQDGRLVGGLYGVSLGKAFFGESMFADVSDASKVAFATLVQQLARWEFELIDCQVHTGHLERLGAEEWDRERFLDALAGAVEAPTRRGRWVLEDLRDG